MQQYPIRFLAAYAVLGAVAIAALIAALAIMFTPVTPVAHKTDINGSLGATTTKELIQQAEKNLAAQASQAGVTITSQKVTKVTHPTSNDVDIYIHLKTIEVGDMDLKVEFHKGIYSIANVSQV